MRKLFKFYRSYYDVAKELPKEDRANFLWAVFEKQFEGIEPNLKGLAKFAYISQKHSIDAQVLGYETKTETKLTPMQGGAAGGVVAPTLQLKEKEEEKDKVKKKISFNNSIFFSLPKFKDAMPKDWNKEKLRYYYDAAIRYSDEGNKYVKWDNAIIGWAKKDELQGKLKFDNKNPQSTVTRVEIKPIKQY